MWKEAREGVWLMATTVDVGALYAALDQQRRQQDLTWRKLAKGMEISPSTFTRMAQGRHPDVDTFVALCSWLGIPAESFTRDGSSREDQEEDNTLAVISTHLRASRKLSPQSAEAIEEIVGAAYQRLKDE